MNLIPLDCIKPDPTSATPLSKMHKKIQTMSLNQNLAPFQLCSKFRYNGHQKRRTCFGTLQQKELKSHVVRFTTQVQTYPGSNQVVASCVNTAANWITPHMGVIHSLPWAC